MSGLIKDETIINTKIPTETISAKKIFNISWDIEIPCFSEKDEYVPEKDANYFFEEDTNLPLKKNILASNSNIHNELKDLILKKDIE